MVLGWSAGDELAAGVGERRRHRPAIVVDEALGDEALHHLREALMRDQVSLRAVVVHLAQRGGRAVALREPREHALARLLENRLLPLLGHRLWHGSRSSKI